ncbi:MAG: translation elongation factor Ts [Tepidisphaeraceae bacterium]
MAAITASLVNELRAKTGLGMMECKKYLTEAEGNVEKAVENIRKAGVKTSVSARATTEGRVFVLKNADGTAAALSEVLCNTDFTAKSDTVAAVMKKACEVALAGKDASADQGIKDAIVAAAQATGENVTLGRVKLLKAPAGGKVGSFLYTVSGKIAVAVAVTGNASDELLNDLCLHLTAFKPVALGLTRESVPADLVAKEREIAVEQAKATGKPQQIAEKIAEGKLGSFFKERVLGEQDFINPDKFKGTVNELLKKAGVTVTDYVRLEVGV